MESVLLAFRLSADHFDPYDDRSSKVIGLKCKIYSCSKRLWYDMTHPSYIQNMSGYLPIWA